MRYYTPGHGVVTDALILHGLLKILSLGGRVDGYVENVGGRFVVDVPKEVELGVLERWELLELLEMATRGVYAGKVRELWLSAIDIAGFKAWSSRLLDAYLDLPRFFDLSEGHRESRREGRGGGRGRKAGGGYTLYLPISSVYGKYVGKSYGLKEEAYTVCASCFALASIGYIYGTLKLRVERSDGFIVFNFAFVPQSRMSVRDMLLLHRLGGHLWVQKRGASLNVAGALIYALSVGETLYAAGGRPAVVAWITERSGNNQRSHRPSVLDATTLLRFIAELKLEVPPWPLLAEHFATHEPAALNALGEYVLFGGDAYAVARQMLSALRSSGTDSARGRKVRNLMAYMEKVTNILLDAERWNLR
jgi:CRISPR-associated protein Csa4